MAATNENSNQIDNAEARPVVLANPNEDGGVLRYKRATFVQGAAAGDAGSTAILWKLPAGRVRVHNALSRIAHSAFGASRVLKLGWQAYTGADGNAVAADDDGLDASVDISSAGSFNIGGTVGGDETYLFESQDGVTLEATVTGGTIPAAATLDGNLYFTTDH